MSVRGGAWAGVAYGSAALLVVAAIPVFVLGLFGAALAETDDPPAYLTLALTAATVMVGGYGWGLSRLGESPKAAIVAFVVPPPVLLMIGLEFSGGWDLYCLALPVVGLAPSLATWRSIRTSTGELPSLSFQFDGRTRYLGVASAQVVIAVLTLAAWWADGLRETGSVGVYPLVTIAGLSLLWRKQTVTWGGCLLVALSAGVAVDLVRRHGANSVTGLLLLWAVFGSLALIAGLLALRNGS